MKFWRMKISEVFRGDYIGDVTDTPLIYAPTKDEAEAVALLFMNRYFGPTTSIFPNAACLLGVVYENERGHIHKAFLEFVEEVVDSRIAVLTISGTVYIDLKV